MLKTLLITILHPFSTLGFLKLLIDAEAKRMLLIEAVTSMEIIYT